MKNLVKSFEHNTYYKNNPIFFLQLASLIKETTKWVVRIKQDKYKPLLEWINYITPQLYDDKYTIQTKVYWILNDIDEFPKCKNPKCNVIFSHRNVQSVSKGYHRFCSHRCAVNSELTKQKAKQTCLNRYGVNAPAQSKEIMSKIKKTCLEKYGCECSLQSTIGKELSKKTCIKKYGVSHPMQSTIIAEKCEQTKLAKYGNIQPWHSTSSYKKREKTWQKKYGVCHPMKVDAIKKKQQQNCLKKYGVKYLFKSQAYIKARCKLLFKRCIEECTYDSPLFTFEDFYKKDHTKTAFAFRCKKCGQIFTSKHVNGSHSHCEKCFPVNRFSSIAENEVKAYIRSLKLDIVENSRNIIPANELDIYISNKRLAIEYDGLFWHNANFKPRSYHINKTTQCEKNNIQLLHIFENEWQLKQDIVKSRIRELVGIHDKTIYARQCTTKLVDVFAEKHFLDENHLQGTVNSSIALGLFHNSQLVSLMTFGKTRFSKKYEWEMLRFCSKLGCHVPGAASKLLKYFEKTYQPKSLVSYADRRWSQGKLYKALGFTLDHISPPNYWYFKANTLNLESRIKYQKHQLKKKLQVFDPLKTEVENMSDNNFYRIFDCGNLVFTKVY